MDASGWKAGEVKAVEYFDSIYSAVEEEFMSSA
jgi:hypothetical protein